MLLCKYFLLQSVNCPKEWVTFQLLTKTQFSDTLYSVEGAEIKQLHKTKTSSFILTGEKGYARLEIEWCSDTSYIIDAWGEIFSIVRGDSFYSLRKENKVELTENSVQILYSNKNIKFLSRGLQRIENIGQEELKKAACCTLSESFESTNSVEISNADGVSGVRQIEMLGLAGKYVLLSRDNVNVFNGVHTVTQLGHIPGAWVQNIHIAKGVGSVANGYEGISGGIAYSLKEMTDMPPFHINGYLNNQLRAEINALGKQKWRKELTHHVYTHASTQFASMDQGKDGFADMPLYRKIHIANLVNYQGKKTEGKFGLNYVNEEKLGGQLGHNTNLIDGIHNHGQYVFKQKESSISGVGNFGVLLDTKCGRSLGNIVHFNVGNQELQFGSDTQYYKAKSRLISYQFFYADEISKSVNFKTGLALRNIGSEESIKRLGDSMQYNTNESNAGAFFELNLKRDKWAAVLGARVDYNSIYRWIFSPRFHAKYEINKDNILHVQTGIGTRSPWVLAENFGMLISNRRILGLQTNNSGRWGMALEQGLNSGIGFTHEFLFIERKSTLSFDAYYTYFLSQVVADRDMNSSQIIFDNQKGNTSFTFQTDWLFKLNYRWDLHAAYRFIHNQQQLNNSRMLQPLISPHRVLLTSSYKTRKNLYFDLIGQYYSRKRMPESSLHGSEMSYSPQFILINLQLRKVIRNWDLYCGIENALNQYQKNPVRMHNDVQNSRFDAALVWGPTNGTNFYVGIRLDIGTKSNSKR